MNPKLKFFPYVIQIGSAPEVLYVNFASNIDQAFTKFLHRHPHLRHSILRPDLFDSSLYYSTSKKTNHACLRLINNLEADGFEVIAGGPLHNPYWQVYVIEINGDPQHLYVGETNYPVEKRFQQHVHKFNPARILLHHDHFEMAMHHAVGWPIQSNKQASLKAEAQLAQDLRDQGFKVAGGH